MFEDFLRNIEQEKKILMDLRSIHSAIQMHPERRGFYMSSAVSLLQQLKMLNQTVPELLKAGLSPAQQKATLPQQKPSAQQVVSPTPANTVRMGYVSPSSKEKRYVTINKQDRKAFLEKLKLSEDALLELKGHQKKDTKQKVTKPSSYARISNKYFRGLSESISPSFTSLKEDLKKANIRFLLTTYISMAIFSVFLATLVGVAAFAALVILSFSNWIYFWVIILLPTLVGAGFYFYPASEASSAQKKISQELPFATIHMAAIAGSDIAPLKIFKIISGSKEYQTIGVEIRKIIAQVDLYGYDLVTSLNNVAKRTPNKNLGELFSGLATNISTGGSLKNYLEKKAENFLLDYKLERQKYADLAGTFMDVYISILIAAPLVLMMMFIVMNVSGLGLAGLSIKALLFLSVVGIAIINVVFMIILNMKQPKV